MIINAKIMNKVIAVFLFGLMTVFVSYAINHEQYLFLIGLFVSLVTFLIGIKKPKYCIFAVVFLLPFAKVLFFDIGFMKLNIFEIIILTLILIKFARFASDTYVSRGSQLLSMVIVFYLCFNLICVLQNYDNIYIAAREFRHNILIPIIFYYLFTCYIKNSRDLTTSLFCLFPGTLFFAILAISAYWISGVRPIYLSRYLDIITLSVLSSICIIFFIRHFFSERLIFSHIYKKKLVVVAILATLGCLLTAAVRTSLIALAIVLLFSKFLIKNLSQKTIFIILGGFIIFSFLFVSNATMPSYLSLKGETKDILRLVDLEGFNIGFQNRLVVWKYMLDYGMQSPLLGKGLGTYEDALRYVTTPIGHSHNFIFNQFLDSGFIGLLILLYIIYVTFRILHKAFKRMHLSADKNLVLIVFSSFLLLLTVGLTNNIFVAGRALLFWAIIGMSSVLGSLKERKRPVSE